MHIKQLFTIGSKNTVYHIRVVITLVSSTICTLLILFRVLMGALTEGWGIVLSVPMLVIVISYREASVFA